MNKQISSNLKRIYIGYEAREHEAYEVCKYSLERHIGKSDLIKPLISIQIPEYKRNTGEPQSTDFTFTRFWLPYLCDYQGYSVFMDCDFMFLKSLYKMLYYIDPSKAVSVVKHPMYIPNNMTKMDDIAQNKYLRKNWSSLMVFNNSHPKNKFLNPFNLNNHIPGVDFHKFKWLDNKDIGRISLRWNVLDGYYYMEKKEIGAIHYTDGGPWFDKYSNTMYSQIWKDMKQEMKKNRET